MTEEEKEAIDDCKNFMNVGDYIGEKEYKELQIAINYISKLQKENQELKEKIKIQIEELKEEKQKIENKGTLIIDEEEGTISHYGVEGMNDVINLIVTRQEIAFFEKILNEEIK